MNIWTDAPPHKMSSEASKMFTGQIPLVPKHYKQYLVLNWSDLKKATIGIVRFLQELSLI
jgi:hypothetical protein